MPPIRVAQHARPAPVEPHHAFAFPADHHLVITTETNVWSWDRSGLTNAFASTSGGILAAKEAKDGSGLLAVADDQVVVLHDATRGMDRSYRLKGSDGQVRLLEYSNDSKSLFFTTTLQNAVQSYSLREATLLEPSHTHPSPPTVLAISPTAHLLLSASEQPPNIFLQNLTLRTPAVQLQPRASTSAVEAAAFHPERVNVFLLAFKDGTLAAYDATRILGKAGRGGSGGEIGRFKGLHTVTNRVGANLRAETGDDQTVSGDQSVSITSAAFLPGHRSRAVSVGADGRCRLLDFEYGGNILRTWHAKGPVTSLSILTVRPKPAQLARPVNRAEISGAPTNTLAVGREDGKVLVFDSVGILLCEQPVDAAAGRIVDVQWMKGPGLRPHVKPAPSPVQQRLVAAGDIWASSTADEADEDDEEFVEDDSGTVYHRPGESPEQRPQINAVNYLDLFSPVKQPPKNSPQRRSPRPRPRPRILSSTFRQSSTSKQPTSPRLNLSPQIPPPNMDDGNPFKRPSSPAQLFSNVFRRHHALEPKSPSKLPSPIKRSASPLRAAPSHDVRIAKTPASKTPRARKSRRTSARMPPSLASASSSRNVTSSSVINSNILADIRRLGESGGKKIAGLALLAPYMNQRNAPQSALRVEQTTQEPGTKSEVVRPEIARVASPTDDIWLTSDDEAPTSHLRSRGGHRLPSHRTQLKRLEEISFMPTPAQESPPNSETSVGNGSEVDENTARIRRRSVLPPGAAESPKGPVRVQEYFPRSSSLEHRRSGSGQSAFADIDNNQLRSPRPRDGRKSGLCTSELFADVRADVKDGYGCECGKKCCATLREDVKTLGEELRLLREEMAEMRFLMGR